jgi:hypothetical protein
MSDRGRTTEWTMLLDRMEARLRRLEAALETPGTALEPGPDPSLESIPMVAPTGFERARLAVVLPAHRYAAAKFADLRGNTQTA